jgi:Lhr-like helicase
MPFSVLYEAYENIPEVTMAVHLLARELCAFEPKLVERELQQLSPDELEKVVASALETSDTFAWRHWHIAKRFGAVERTAEYKATRARLLVKVFKDTPLEEETKKRRFTGRVIRASNSPV